MKREILTLQYDMLLQAIMEIEGQISGKIGKKGFTTYIPKGKIFYHVRYYEDGKQIGDRSLATTDKNEADSLAKRYREPIIKNYYDKKNKIQDISAFFSDYYKLEKSKLLQELLKRKERKISIDTVKKYDNFLNNYFVPFLQERKIKTVEQIKINVLKDFQNFLLEKSVKLEKGLKPKTINTNINGAVIQIFYNLYNKGIIKEMPFIITDSFNLPESEDRRVIRSLGIYESLMVLQDADMWKLYRNEKDIATDKFSNRKSYKKNRLICLLMGTMGLRNAEIFMLRKSNIIQIRRLKFLEIVNSHTENKERGTKTKNAVRKVPIPAVTLAALNDYIAEYDSTFNGDYLFYIGSKSIPNKVFNYSGRQFGALCGYDENELKEKDFVFYGLRHFYKKFLERSELKTDIVEYFMGHSVNFSNMGERYNDRESLDAEFFEDFGIKINKYIDSMFAKVLEKYELLPAGYATIEKISLTDDRGNKQSYFANVLLEIDYDTEIYHTLGDYVEKGVLVSLNDKSGVKKLLDENIIDERKYDDFIFYIENHLTENDL
jgi:integrase